MVQIVINTGSGFDLSHNAIMRYAELKGIKLTTYQLNIESGWDDKYNGPVTEMMLVYYFIDVIDDIIQFENYSDKYFVIYNIDRTDPALIQVVEELKESEQLDLKIVEVPDDVKWEIEENETGTECVREVSRCWS